MKKYIKLLLILGIAFNMMHGKALADQSVSGDISSGSYVRTVSTGRNSPSRANPGAI